jgi:CRISPR/Cas system CSM-associated protein Csm3 (group 7 of RAMP superfamily)
MIQMANVSKPVRIGVVLTFQTPPSIAAAGTLGSIADRFAERNARGQFVIPGSQLKGKLRHACEQVVGALGQPICQSPRPQTMCPNPPGGEPHCPVCVIFGNPAFASPLRFHDLVSDLSEVGENMEVEPSLRAMVSLNRRRATAAEKRLFLVETAPYYPGLRFGNEVAITGNLQTAAQIKLLLAGLKLITAWGGMKSRGAGWSLKTQATALFNNSPVEENAWQEITQLWNE